MTAPMTQDLSPRLEAKKIDETIYAYIDDDYFNLSYEEFIEKVIKYLD